MLKKSPSTSYRRDCTWVVWIWCKKKHSNCHGGLGWRRHSQHQGLATAWLSSLRKPLARRRSTRGCSQREPPHCLEVLYFSFSDPHTHTHTHLTYAYYVYICIYIYIKRKRERERGRERERERKKKTVHLLVCSCNRQTNISLFAIHWIY